jgi:hypothetical protein
MELLGISSGKIASITFLLVTLFLALFLSSVDFLKTNNIADVPIIYEGMDDKEEDYMDDEKIEGMEGEDEEYVDDEEIEGMEGEEEEYVDDEKIKGMDDEIVEGFDVRSQSLQYSLIE